ncbi:hypothetical protein UR09_03575 [Candidatus Nitromaritima sp. SCGC AAA799-A02]|nr:hypothetical protein UR09_03575 [Candidatus Nitromaritima sp. SCGC AAA799-A02]
MDYIDIGKEVFCIFLKLKAKKETGKTGPQSIFARVSRLCEHSLKGYFLMSDMTVQNIGF